MAKTKSPLWGIAASGTIGGEVVYSSWRGIKYARRHVIPANPRTAEQIKTRGVFTFASDLWAAMPPDVHEVNDAAASGRPILGRNVFIGNNVKALREATDLSNLVVSPGANGGFALTSLTAEVSDNTVIATASVPTLPVGWTVDKVVFILISDQDPHERWTGVLFYDSATSVPYSVSFEDVASGTYYCTAWAVYTRPDGRKAYGPSLIVPVTVS
jgi:hypothetical protein